MSVFGFPSLYDGLGVAALVEGGEQVSALCEGDGSALATPPTVATISTVGVSAIQSVATHVAAAVATASTVGVPTVAVSHTVAQGRPVFAGASSLVGVTAGNVTPSLPVGWEAGDVALLLAGTNDSNTFPTPTGWTVLGGRVSANGSTRLYYRRLQAGDTDPTFTIATGTALSAANGLFARIWTWRGASSTGVALQGSLQQTANTTASPLSSSTTGTLDTYCQVVSLLAVNNDVVFTSGFPASGWVPAGSIDTTTVGLDQMACAMTIPMMSASTQAAAGFGTLASSESWSSYTVIVTGFSLATTTTVGVPAVQTSSTFTPPVVATTSAVGVPTIISGTPVAATTVATVTSIGIVEVVTHPLVFVDTFTDTNGVTTATHVPDLNATGQAYLDPVSSHVRNVIQSNQLTMESSMLVFNPGVKSFQLNLYDWEIGYGIGTDEEPGVYAWGYSSTTCVDIKILVGNDDITIKGVNGTYGSQHFTGSPYTLPDWNDGSGRDFRVESDGLSYLDIHYRTTPGVGSWTLLLHNTDATKIAYYAGLRTEMAVYAFRNPSHNIDAITVYDLSTLSATPVATTVSVGVPSIGTSSSVPAVNWIAYNGTTDYLLVTEAEVGATNWTAGVPLDITFFVKTTHADGILLGQWSPASATVGGAPAAGGHVPAIYIDTSGFVRASCFWHNSTSAQNVSTSVVTDGKVHRIRVTYSGGVERLYIDGVEEDNQTVSQTFYSSDIAYTLGVGYVAAPPWAALTGGWNYFEGDLALDAQASVRTVASVGVPTITIAAAPAPPVVATVSAVGVPVVDTPASATVAAVVVASTSSVGVPAIVSPATVPAISVATVTAVGVPVTKTGATFTPPVIVTSSTVGVPVVQTGLRVAAIAVATVTAVGVPVTKTGATISAISVATVTTVGVPVVPVVSAPPAVVTTSTVGVPTISTGAKATPPVVVTTTAVGVPVTHAGATITTATVATTAFVPTFQTTPLVTTAAAAWRARDYSGTGPVLDLTGNGYDLTVVNATFSGDHFVNTNFGSMLTRTGHPTVGDGPLTLIGVFSGINGNAGNLVDLSDNFDATSGVILTVSGDEVQVWYFDTVEFESVEGEMADFYGVQTYAVVLTPTEATTYAKEGVLAPTGPGLTWNVDGATELRVGETFGVGAGACFWGGAIFDVALTGPEIAQAGRELLHGVARISATASVTATAVATVSAVGVPSVETASPVSVPAVAVATVSTVGVPIFATGATPAPPVVQTAIAVGVPTISAGATVTSVTVATTCSVGVPVTQTSSTVTPSVVVTASTVGVPAITAPATSPPAAVVTTTTVGVPVTQTGSTVTTTSVVTATAVGVPTLSAGATTTAGTVATASTVPPPSLSSGAGITVAASTVATSSAVEQVAVSTGSTTSPASIATVTSIPEPAAVLSATVAPTAVASTSTVGAPAVATSSSLAATAVSTAVAIGVPAFTSAATVTPAAVASSTTIGVPATSTTGVATPATVVTSSSVGAPTVAASSTVAATRVDTTVGIPAPTTALAAVATPATISTTTSVPTASPSEQLVAPAAIITFSTVPATTPATGSTATPATIGSAVSIGIHVPATGATVAADVLVTVTGIGTPSVSTSALVLPASVATVSVVEEPFLTSGGHRVILEITVEERTITLAVTDRGVAVLGPDRGVTVQAMDRAVTVETAERDVDSVPVEFVATPL